VRGHRRACKDSQVAALSVRVLGPLELNADDAELRVNGDRQRGLLAALALSAGRPVAVAELMQALWDDGGDHEHRLQQQVSTLRKVLEPDRARHAAPAALVTIAPGYALRGAEVDVESFAPFADAGLAAVRDRSWSDALAALDAALGLWRGQALVDVRLSPWFETRATGLDTRRLTVIEARIDCLLELGQHHEAVADLEELVGDHPYRERFRGQLMLALYRTNRQADALAVFRDTRTILVEELGVEPSPELRAIEQAILEHDSSLHGPTTTTDLLETVRPDAIECGYIRRPDGQIITLGDGSTVIGRDPEAQVHMADSRVSRRHARVDKLADGYHAFDLGSTNGTTVNGEPATGQLLADGDTIGLGRVEIRFGFGRLENA
jgi:DNA-binding SARP family transcriptional activator